MKSLETSHKQKSAAITFVVAVLLVLIFSVLGLTYYDPPIRYGIEVNFGTSSSGFGEEQVVEDVMVSNVETNQKIAPAKATPKEVSNEIINEIEPEVLTQTEESIPVVKEKKVEKPIDPVEKEEQPVKEIEPPAPKPEQPKISKAVENALSKVLNANANKKAEESEGEKSSIGDQGEQSGNPYASSYYSNVSVGGNAKGYGLNGRKLMSNGSVTQECDREGTIVVRISVNQDGKVVAAEPGVKGSKNVHPCLLEPARQTALLHQWYPDYNAPTSQVGFIVVNFKMSN